MPPKRSTRRTVKKKDAEPSELLLKQAEEVITEKANNFWSCTGPIIINNNYNQKKEGSIDTTNHWTKNKHDIKCLYLWHIDQQIGRLQFEFHRTVNWNEYRKIDHLNKSKKTLLEDGIILETITAAELRKLYCDYGISTLKNFNNHYFQYCYYQHPEQGEVTVEEVSS
jgi:hypothetical protein